MKTNPNHSNFAGRRDPKPDAIGRDTRDANRPQEAFQRMRMSAADKGFYPRRHGSRLRIERPRSLSKSMASIPAGVNVPSGDSGRVSGTIRRRPHRLLRRANCLSVERRIPTRPAMTGQADSKSPRRCSNQGSRRKTIKLARRGSTPNSPSMKTGKLNIRKAGRDEHRNEKPDHFLFCSFPGLLYSWVPYIPSTS